MARAEDCRYAKTHEWVHVEGGLARIGISDYAQGELGDIVYVNRGEKGKTVAVGKEFGVIVEDKVSLSERFGLWISFYPFSQAEQLAIAAQWLRNFGVPEADIGAAQKESLVRALERGSRSGRVAQQFAHDWTARHRG